MSWLTAIKDEYNKQQTKAISHRPDLAGRVHILTSRDNTIEAPSLANYTDYASVHEQHAWFYRGVKVLSDNFTPLITRVVRGDEGEPIDNHPLTVLFDGVNDQYGQAELKAQWLTSMVFSGEAFMEVVSGERNRAPLQFWARRPDRIAVIPDATRPAYPLVVGYRWAEAETTLPDWDADEMVMWKFNNPTNPWRGLSLIGAAQHGLTIDIFAQAWSKKFLKQGGNPDWALIAPQGITQTERETYERIIEQKFLGWENWHKPIVLEDGVTDIKPLSFPPKDIQWIEQRKLAREEIGAILGVPDVLLGFGPETYDTEEKRKTALRTLWTLTLVPLVEFYDDKLNHFFRRVRPMLQGDERLETDLSVVGILNEDISPKVETALKLFGMGIPFNIIDERLALGIGEVEGGDTGYLPINLLPAGSVGIMPAPSMAPEPEPEPESEPEPPPEEDLEESRNVTETVTKQEIGKAPEFGSIEHRALMLRQDVLTRPFERRMVADLKKYFQRQQIEVGRRLRDRQPKQDAARIPPTGELFDLEAEIEAFKREMYPVVSQSFDEAGNAALGLVLGPEAPEFRTVPFSIQQILEQQSIKTNNTTWQGLTELFQLASQEGASVPDMMDRLSAFFTERKQDYQLERIARTTMIASHNSAAMAGYHQSGVVKSSEWIAAIDGRERDAHREAHGQQRPLGAKFDVGGEPLAYPGDPAGSAGNIINCRCSVLPITF